MHLPFDSLPRMTIETTRNQPLNKFDLVWVGARCHDRCEAKLNVGVEQNWIAERRSSYSVMDVAQGKLFGD